MQDGGCHRGAGVSAQLPAWGFCAGFLVVSRAGYHVTNVVGVPVRKQEATTFRVAPLEKPGRGEGTSLNKRVQLGHSS